MLTAAPLHSVAKDNLGKENKRVTAMSGSWHVNTNSVPLEVCAKAAPARSMVCSSTELKLVYQGLKKDALYKVRLTYLSDNPGREQAVYIDGKLVREQFALPAKKILTQEILITREAASDGKIEISVEKRSGPNAILSEVELLSDSPRLVSSIIPNYYGYKNAIHGTVTDVNGLGNKGIAGIKITAEQDGKSVVAEVQKNGGFQLTLPEQWLEDKDSDIKLSCTHASSITFKTAVLFKEEYLKMVLDKTTHDPFELAIADDGRVFYIERLGKVKMCLPNSQSSKEIGKIDVYSKLDDGLLGLALDPHFSENNWIFLYYSTPAISENVLARFTLKDNQLDMSSEKIILRVPVNRDTPPCHTGGSLAFDSKGNLFISTGDNVIPFHSSGSSPTDTREGRGLYDAQGTSADTNDLRGKILRITPQADGSYTIPEGNLFRKGQKKTKAEIYVMGCRNPFRIGVNQKTDTLYWGEVGPDAKTKSNRGPAGHDEFNQAIKAGNYGWPHFVGNNRAYSKYDFETKKISGKWNEQAPQNNSPNNKGLVKLPPAQSALAWYPYAASSEFPMLNSGGRCAMGGPVYHYDENLKSAVKLPKRYHNTAFFYDWARGWIMAVKLDENEKMVKVERFMAKTNFKRPMDLELGSDGALYLIEWGSSYGGSNPDAQIVRLQPGVHLNALGTKEPSAEEQKQALIAKFKGVLTGGDAAEGKALFKSPRAGCVYCHVSDDEGGIIGPNLVNIGSQLNRQELLDSIVFPSKRIPDQYLSLTAVMKNGKTYAGGMGGETETHLTVRTTDQGEVKLLKSDIKKLIKGVSPMPAGIGEAFSPDDMRHIVEYLSSLKKP